MPGSSERPMAGVMANIVRAVTDIVGPQWVRLEDEDRERYGRDGSRHAAWADLVVLPASTAEVAAVARVCDETRTPLVPRGAGTGYTGGAVPARGGVVLSLERLNRIVEISEADLVAVVEPNVITGDLQDAVERVGLFYPPDPASLRQCAIGGNVAENAGGPRAFKYGVTKHYVLGLEAVLPTGEVVQVGGRTVKNVVGYDLAHLITGSEGTLAIVTRITLRLIPKPPAAASIRAAFPSVDAAADAVAEVVRARVVPAAIELIDRHSLEAVTAYLGGTPLAPAGSAAMLLIEVDGHGAQVAAEAPLVADACRRAGAADVLVATDAANREEIWRVRRELSPALRTLAPVKFNHDVVVPKGRLTGLFALVDELRRQHDLLIACFGHVGDGNVHVNMMVDATPEAAERATAAEGDLFRGVVALGGSISGEHGIGSTKSRYLGLELTPTTIALMQRVKRAFDPHGILNPGKIFPEAR